MAAKRLSKRSPARRSKRSPATSTARRSVRSLAVAKKRLLGLYSAKKHGPLTNYCRRHRIVYHTAYSFLNSGKQNEREQLRKLIVSVAEKLKLVRRKKGQHRNLSAACIREEIGADKCPIGERQINRILKDLYGESRPRRIPQRPTNTGITQEQLDHLNRQSEDW